MNIPTDKRLDEWIRQLISENNIIKFYKTKEWMQLKQEVMWELHYECQECLKKGKYSKADCVHHVNEVRLRPDLALSKYYLDKDGKEQRNLLPVCNHCHNKIHDKLGSWQYRDKFKNKERW